SDDREHRKRNIDNGILVECLYRRFLDAPIAEQLYIWPVAVSSGHTKKYAFSDGMTRSKGEMVLNLMNEHLSVWPFFVGDDYTLADIALYAYTHVAHEGGYDLSDRPALKAWLDRVANQPGYVTMDAD
ncbi:MAG: glutathione binding-like protein, partial [Pseudomonadota bacterium]|nr:glutathione binding-like protein [Pseudomonadota bacterium]